MDERPNNINVSVKVKHRPAELFKTLSNGVGRGCLTSSSGSFPGLRSGSEGGAGLFEIAGRNVVSRSFTAN